MTIMRILLHYVLQVVIEVRRQRQKYFAPSILWCWRCFCNVFRTFDGCIKLYKMVIRYIFLENIN